MRVFRLQTDDCLARHVFHHRANADGDSAARRRSHQVSPDVVVRLRRAQHAPMRHHHYPHRSGSGK